MENQGTLQMKLLFVGDVMLGRLVNAVLQGKPPGYPWGDTLSLFHHADVRLCNLECVISDWGTPWSATPKVFHFRSDAKNIATLKAASIDAVSLANNHTLDFEYEGLFHMMSNLDAAGIHYAGAGATITEASEAAIWEVKGKKLGLIAFTDNEPGWEATEEQPGLVYVPITLKDKRAVKLLELVSKTKAVVDFLVVSAHWGSNWGYTPPAEHIPFAHALIDAGADVIFGHSGHVVRGIELYKGKPILYCTGDFLDDYAVDERERNDQSFLFVVETDGQAIVRLLLYPTVIEACQARRAKRNEREAIVTTMQRLCMQLNTTTIWDRQEERLEVWLNQHTPLRLAPTAQTLATSATLAMNEAVAKRRAAGQETIHLGFGEAAFPLHPLLATALAEAAKRTGYAPVLGIPALRKAIAAYLARKRGLTFSSDQIVVGPGSKPLLYALLQVLEGDLLLPVPSWVSYAPQARLASRRVIGVETDSGDHHRLTPQALSRAMDQAHRDGADPRILLVNTPSNPTGSMFDRSDVEALALWAREQGITLISDEIYAELAHGWREHVSPAFFYPEGCIVTGGLSKAFSAGGWRLGYAALPTTTAGTQAMAALRALASEIWSAAATPVQEAALAAFSLNESVEQYVQRSARIYGYVSGRLYDTLASLGVPCPRPAGAFYLYPDFSPWRPVLMEQSIRTGADLAHYLLEEWDIATLPGSAFGEPPESLCLRLSTSLLCQPGDAASPDEREAALWRLLEQADSLPPENESGEPALSLPALGRAQTRLTEVIQFFRRYHER